MAGADPVVSASEQKIHHGKLLAEEACLLPLVASYRILPPVLHTVLPPSAEVLRHAEYLLPVAHISPNEAVPNKFIFDIAIKYKGLWDILLTIFLIKHL